MPKRPEYQVQIYDKPTKTWYGWTGSEYDATDKADAKRACNIARQHGWYAYVVKIS